MVMRWAEMALLILAVGVFIYGLSRFDSKGGKKQ